MDRHLPLLADDGFAATQRCTYCPKLCRPGCPVSTETGRETHTPWGKMRALGEVLRGASPADAEGLEPAWACTGCHHCTELCELGNPAVETLRDGRARAFSSGALPESVSSWHQQMPSRATRLAQAGAALEDPSGPVRWLPGCTAVVTENAATLAAREALRRREPSLGCTARECCGMPLLEAGAREDFARQASAFSSQLSGARLVISSDAGCTHALRTLYPALGLALPPVLHVTEWLEARLETLRPRPGAPTVLHDPCRLGRGLGIYDAPRRVARALLGREALELPFAREHAPCSGAGALVPVTMPAASAGIACSLAEQARGAGATRVLSPCAATRNTLRRAGLEAVSFEDLLD